MTQKNNQIEINHEDLKIGMTPKRSPKNIRINIVFKLVQLKPTTTQRHMLKKSIANKKLKKTQGKRQELLVQIDKFCNKGRLNTTIGLRRILEKTCYIVESTYIVMKIKNILNF